jgi:hypothetical protein
MENNMRKLSLTIAAGVAVLFVSTLPSRAAGLPVGDATSYRTAIDAIYRPSVDVAPMVEPARLVCTHFWNGRWHYRKVCFSTPGYRHHYGRFRRHWY